MRSPAVVPAAPSEDIERLEPSLSRTTGPRAVAAERIAARTGGLRAGERIAVLSDDQPAARGLGRGVLAKLAIVVVVLLALYGVASLLRSFVGL